jgi:osmotically-inducible protein OsmY
MRMKNHLSMAMAAVLVAVAAPAAFAQAEVVSPAASGSISGTSSGSDSIDNHGSTSFGDSRATASDSVLRDNVISALDSDPALRGAELSVDVDHGMIGITGHARDPGQAARAGRVAAQAANGARVETNIDLQ